MSVVPSSKGGTLIYLKVVVNFPTIDPHFLHFTILLSPHFMAHLDPINLILRKKSVCLYPI